LPIAAIEIRHAKECAPDRGHGRPARRHDALDRAAARAEAVEPEQPWRGLYLGGGGVYSTVSVEVFDCDDDCHWWGDYSAYDNGDGGYGWSVHAGLRLHKYFALEANSIDTDDIRWDQDLIHMPEFNDHYNNRVDFSAQVTEVSALAILPVLEIWEIYLRLGAGYWDGQSQQRLDQSFGTDVVTRNVEYSGTGFLFGVGGGVTLGKAFHLRLDLQSVDIDEDVLNARDDSSIESLLLEVQFRFGAH
jgi:hypothetical protein